MGARQPSGRLRKAACPVRRSVHARAANHLSIDSANINVHSGHQQATPVDSGFQETRHRHRIPVQLHHVCLSEEGQRTPIVALHGLFGSWHNINPILQDFTEDRQVFCLDLRNHGESPRVADMNLETQVEDVKLVLDRHNLETSILVGHGIGGRIASALALKYPERVAGIISVDGLPGSFEKQPLQREYEHVFERLIQVPVIEVMSRMEADKEMTELFSGLSEEARALILASYMPDVAGRPGSWSWQFYLHGLKRQIENIVKWPVDKLAPFEGPALFCVQDIWEEADFETTKRQFPNWKLHKFEGTDNEVNRLPDLALTSGYCCVPKKELCIFL